MEEGGEGGRGSLMEALAVVPDPRSRHGQRHPLTAILALAVCAMLCGARSLYAIAQWGRDHEGVAKPLGFSREKTPCVSTLHEVFSRLDREAFEGALGGWLKKRGVKRGDGVAVDGKQLRGIHGEELPGVRLLSAYAHRKGIVVGQRGVAEGRNELEALPGLLRELGLEGTVMTGDAQFTQREVCHEVVEKGGTISWSSKTIRRG